MDDVLGIKQASMMQNFIIGHKVVPADVQDALLAPYLKGIQSILISLYEGPGLRSVE